MAELSSLTYSINISDEVLKELAALRAEVSQIRGSQLIHEAWVDCQESKLGKKVAELVSAKYKEMLAEQEGVAYAPIKTLDEHVKELEVIVSEATLVHTQPFIVQQGQVYINQAFLDEGVQSDNYKARTPGKADGSGWKLGADADFELNSANTKVVIKDGVLKVFDNNNTLRTRVQL